jgi:hypothetical protein
MNKPYYSKIASPYSYVESHFFKPFKPEFKNFSNNLMSKYKELESNFAKSLSLIDRDMLNSPESKLYRAADYNQ